MTLEHAEKARNRVLSDSGGFESLSAPHAWNRALKAASLAAGLWLANGSDETNRHALAITPDVSSETAALALAILERWYAVVGGREDIEAEAISNHRPRPAGV